MEKFLNFHAHRNAVDKTEIAVRNLTIGHEDPTAINVPFSVGIHPWYIPGETSLEESELQRLSAHPLCLALGETGLDKTVETDMHTQMVLFKKHIVVAARLGLPIVVHCVRAWAELIAVKKETNKNVSFVIHGFRGKPLLMNTLLQQGFYLGFGFHHNAESLVCCPEEKLLLETDEDARNVSELYITAAQLRGCSPERLREQCFENFCALLSESKKQVLSCYNR